MILGTHSRQLLSVGNCTLNKEEPLNDDVDGGELSFISEYKLKKTLPGLCLAFNDDDAEDAIVCSPRSTSKKCSRFDPDASRVLDSSGKIPILDFQALTENIKHQLLILLIC